jgi:hypothetical protein
MNRSTKIPFAVLACALVVAMAIGTPAFAPNTNGPVQESEAVVPAVPAAVIGGAITCTVVDCAGFAEGWLSGTGEEVTKSDEYTLADYQKTAKQVQQSSASIHFMHRKQMGFIDSNFPYMKGVAFRKARAAYAEALMNNKTESQARTIANETIDNYVVQQQKQIVDTHNFVWNTRYPDLKDAIKGHSSWNGAKWHAVSQDYKPVNHGSETRTLVDGDTEVSIATWEWKQSGTTYGTGTITDYDQQSSPREYPLEFTCQDDGNCGVSADYYRLAETNEAWTNVKNIHSSETDDINNLIDSTYDGYENGTLNISQIAGPATMAQEWDTSDSHAHSAAALAYMGINGSIETQVQLEGMNESRGLDWYNGTLFTNWSPNGTDGKFKTDGYYTPHSGSHSHTLETGTPHADADSQKVVYVATTDGRVVQVNETVRVHSLTDVQSGETVNNVTTVKHVDRYVNTSSIDPSVFDGIEELNAKLDALQESGAGGSGSGGSILGNLSMLEKLAIALGTVAVIVAVAMMNSGPKARRRY